MAKEPVVLRSILADVKRLWDVAEEDRPTMAELATHLDVGTTTIRRALTELGFKNPCTFHKTEVEKQDLFSLQCFNVHGDELKEALKMYVYLKSRGATSLGSIEGRISVF